uniref:Potassium channel domain-containing protein n=1 Tax=Lotharella oceanica TaxID=641309 RepID=A0A7S2TH13_9EUKA
MAVAILLQVIMVFSVYLISPTYFYQREWNDRNNDDEHTPNSAGLVISLCACIQCLACGMVTFATVQVGRDFRSNLSNPSAMFKVFVATVTCFGGIYFLICTTDRHALVRTVEEENSVSTLSMGIRCLYFSTATMTSVGFGDIVATHWATVVTSTLQMMLAMMYTVGFFVICLHQFREQTEMLSYGRGEKRSLISRCTKWIRMNVPGMEQARKFIIRFLFPVCVAVEVIAVSIFLGTESSTADPFEGSDNIGALAASITIQVLELITILLVSMRLVQKARSHEVSVSFLIQSFLSTATLFAGIYFTMMMMDREAFRSFHQRSDHVFAVAGWLFYFSITTQTTTGYGDVYPAKWFSQAVVIIQMLIAFLYNVVILGLGMVHIINVLPSLMRKARNSSVRRSSARPSRNYSRGNFSARGWRGYSGATFSHDPATQRFLEEDEGPPNEL